MLITGKLENEHLICTNEERLYLYQQSTQISATARKCFITTSSRHRQPTTT